ncbi:MAG: cysteine synthase family protein [Gemmatimonadales bacterium]|nr:MAG: cysteine synthase family protein [Gemmatimonadales bacterium]
MPAQQPQERLSGLASLIGNTPLLAIEFEYRGARRVVHAKAEHLNLSGSIKDRMAIHILRQGYATGALQPGALIVEATSGNTGIAFASIGRALGHPVTIFMPAWMSSERINLIRSLGASIVLVSREEGGFLGSIEMAEELARKTPGAFLPRQFSNRDNCDAHYQTTGPEIYGQLAAWSLTPAAFVAGVGTGGTIMGTGKYLREKVPGIKLHPVEPSNSPTMSTGHKVGQHRIQGISDEFIPAIVELDKLDEILAIDDGDAILMAQELATKLGLGVGISSGANFLACVHAQEALGGEAVVATVFADDNKKYLSTDLLREEPLRDGFLTPEIALRGLSALRRTCGTCRYPDPAPAGWEAMGSR